MNDDQRGKKEELGFYQKLGRIRELTQVGIALTFVFYILGFVITNLYLGSFGVVTFTILRARYISTGLLFGVFVTIIFVPLYECWHILLSNTDRSTKAIVTLAVSQSLYRYITILFIVGAISVLAPTNTRASLAEASQSQSSLPSALQDAGQDFLWGLVRIVPLMLFVLAIAFAAIFIINPKDKNGVRTTRRSHLRQFMASTARASTYLFILKFVFLALLLYTAIVLTLALIEFLGGDAFQIFPSLINLDWLRLVGVAFLIYGLIITFYVVNLIMSIESNKASPSSVKATEESLFERYYTWVTRAAWIVILTVPVYALNLYETLPQNIGGGKPIKVHVELANDMELEIIEDAKSTFLLDRTTEGVILMTEGIETSGIIEIPVSRITAIVYEPSD